MRRTPIPTLAALLAVLLAGSASAAVKKSALVKVTVEAQVAAPPSAVWAQLTQGKNLVTWCPMWKAPANAKVSLARVGDVLDFTDDWGNGGRSVVTYLAKDKEIRVTHEPNNGSYMCQARLVLSPAGGGTKLSWTDSYTDDGALKDQQANSAKMEAEMRESLTALAKGAAGK